MTREYIAHLARIACDRRAAEVRMDLQRGHAGLASVTATATLLAGLETTFWVLRSFKANVGTSEYYGYYAAEAMMTSMIFIFAGLAAAIPALWIRSWICCQIEELEMEMKSAGIQLENYLLFYQNERGKPNTCSAM